MKEDDSAEYQDSLPILAGKIPLDDLLRATKEAGIVAAQKNSSPLNRCILAGILGALHGFSERELSPFLPTHISLFPEIKEELTKAITENPPNPEEIQIWLKECFEYGIKKVYHLEWKLYSSQELY
ncbi:hypothetical protein CH373_10170 [Leptospira perolatii]|uniref:Uncharacterized protein n=1 Tax=Leptospira perolatii TaxID=2023191 RepID=A0A2M9ZMQ5_9LEPT|nr:hypothetical protein [Leptospira perolatii]PJZ70136.1 hypothetical protein CH360_07915 [Leptospira perolatii]PJZ73325.1 hypothetical protein CH373_10170 [Leptospira perolatii]